MLLWLGLLSNGSNKMKSTNATRAREEKESEYYTQNKWKIERTNERTGEWTSKLKEITCYYCYLVSQVKSPPRYSATELRRFWIKKQHTHNFTISFPSISTHFHFVHFFPLRFFSRWLNENEKSNQKSTHQWHMPLQQQNRCNIKRARTHTNTQSPINNATVSFSLCSDLCFSFDNLIIMPANLFHVISNVCELFNRCEATDSSMS